MGKLIVLMGPTGAGKSVQGDILANSLGGVHMSSGNLLREDPTTAALIKGGKLFPAAEVERVLAEALAKIPTEQPVVLDGTPRTMSNVRWLERELPMLGRTLVGVILIDLDFETLSERLQLRGRADDAPDAVRVKWDAYEAETKPVLDYYRSKDQLKVVDGRGSVEAVSELIRDALV